VAHWRVESGFRGRRLHRELFAQPRNERHSQRAVHGSYWTRHGALPWPRPVGSPTSGRFRRRGAFSLQRQRPRIREERVSVGSAARARRDPSLKHCRQPLRVVLHLTPQSRFSVHLPRLSWFDDPRPAQPTPSLISASSRMNARRGWSAPSSFLGAGTCTHQPALGREAKY